MRTGLDETVTAQASAVTDSVLLILSPDNLTITVKATTADGSAVTVEGCTETTLASDTETTLHAQGTTVILKGKITALSCQDNQLTALNVQGLSALQELDCGGNQLTTLNVQSLSTLQELGCSRNQLTELGVQGSSALQELWCGNNLLTELDVRGLSGLYWLDCSGNQLNAQALTSLLTGLPSRSPRDDTKCILYTEDSDEGNYTDFPEFIAPAELYTALQNAVTKNWKLCYWNSERNLGLVWE